MTKLFVSGFPLETDEMALARLIAPHGNISTIKIVRDRQTKKCKGYAFIEMETLTDAENASIALDGEMMNDRELTVKITEDKPVAPKPRFGSRQAYPKPGFNRSSEHTSSDDDRDKRQRRPRM